MDVCNRFLAPFVPFAISLNCFEYLHRFIFLIFLQHSGCVGLMGLFGVGMCMAVSVCWRCWASVADRWGFLSFPLCREITNIEVHFMVVFSNKGFGGQVHRHFSSEEITNHIDKKNLCTLANRDI